MTTVKRETTISSRIRNARADPENELTCDARVRRARREDIEDDDDDARRRANEAQAQTPRHKTPKTTARCETTSAVPDSDTRTDPENTSNM